MKNLNVFLVTLFFCQLSYSKSLINFPEAIIQQRMEVMAQQALKQCDIEITEQELKLNLVPVVMGCKKPQGVELKLEDESLSCRLRC